MGRSPFLDLSKLAHCTCRRCAFCIGTTCTVTSRTSDRKRYQALSSHGVPLTLSQIEPENLEELIDHLEDLTVDVEGKEGNTVKVRVFCE